MLFRERSVERGKREAPTTERVLIEYGSKAEQILLLILK
jgi:hypothetical protein